LVRRPSAIRPGPCRHVRPEPATVGLVTNFGVSAPPHEITIEFWQKVDAAANQFIFALDPDSPRNRLAGSGPSRLGAVSWQFGDGLGVGQLHYWPPEPVVGAWQHFAFVAGRCGN
jgi:hypothetical protein